MSTLDIKNFTRSTPASGVPFGKIAAAILPGWEISLVFAGESRAQQLNVALRRKDYIPNVLSYESGTKSGEIIICPAVVKRQAKNYGMTPKNFIAYLFIHGVLHLKGHPHGTTMERYERTYLARFGFSSPTSTHATTHRNRN